LESARAGRDDCASRRRRVTILVGSVSADVSLVTTAEEYYRANRFADLWADVKRAPRNVATTTGEIPELPGYIPNFSGRAKRRYSLIHSIR
jgi:hypothetical protein